MEYLDPQKEMRHRIVLFTGYICIGVAIVIATLVLVYQAYGFGLGKNGDVIQNGIVFFSSQPAGADIYLNGKLNKDDTDTRLSIPENVYDVRIAREGYIDWRRRIELNGGSVKHFDYPFLIPEKLETKQRRAYSAAPPAIGQSLDRRWLMVKHPQKPLTFDLYDLSQPDPELSEVTLPPAMLANSKPTDKWQFMEWADNNRHAIFLRSQGTRRDYVLIDRSDPAQSRNLSTHLASGTKRVYLLDKKHDQYYLHNNATTTLETASLNSRTAVKLLDRVLTFKAVGRDTLLYATDNGAKKGTVNVELRTGDQTHHMRSFPAGTSYLLDMAQYSRKTYMALGTSDGDKVYIYKDPLGQRRTEPERNLVPIQVLHVPKTNYLSFSPNAQFVLTENGRHLGVYDIENQVGHNYTAQERLDRPQSHAAWMDGHRLTYVSGKTLQIFDYDYNNKRSLIAADPSYLPVFTPDYDYLYIFVPGSGQERGKFLLTETALRTPADL